MIRRSCLLTITVVLAGLSSTAQGQSLWERRVPERVYLFTDTQARHIGDLLTVIVDENTDVENKDERNLEKSTEASGGLDVQAQTDETSGSLNFDAKGNSNRKFDGSSEYSVEQELSDRITVAVMDVLPNGNMVIGGRRKRVVSGEMRTLVISGIVRPLDIRPDNTIRSQFIANFRVDYLGKGPESEFTNQGWFGKTLNVLWPF